MSQQNHLESIFFHAVILWRKVTSLSVLTLDLNQELFQNHSSALIATWHSNGYWGVPLFGSLQTATLTSLSKDGELMRKYCEFFGMQVFRGSSSKGGFQVIRNMLHTFKQKPFRMILTVDGSRGPLHEVQPGIAFLAYQLQLPVIPWDFDALPKWQAKSWDQHKIPKPFSLCINRFAPPVSPPQNKEALAQYPALLKSKMMENRQEIESCFEKLQDQGFGNVSKRILTKIGLCQLPDEVI